MALIEASRGPERQVTRLARKTLWLFGTARSIPSIGSETSWESDLPLCLFSSVLVNSDRIVRVAGNGDAGSPGDLQFAIVDRLRAFRT